MTPDRQDLRVTESLRYSPVWQTRQAFSVRGPRNSGGVKMEIGLEVMHIHHIYIVDIVRWHEFSDAWGGDAG